MPRLFLNDPKPPKGANFYIPITLIVLFILVQLGLLYYFLRPLMKPVEQPKEAEALPSAELFEQGQSLSVRSPETVAELEAFFGPLPSCLKQPAVLKVPYPVKGIYIGTADKLDEALALAAKTEINAFVIDLKLPEGLTYKSKVALAKDIGASKGDLPLADICRRCHEAGIYVIGRIVCFKDTTLTEKRPDLCICDKSGKLLTFPLEGDIGFANPYDTRVWSYLIELGKEARSLGADEIQWDEVCFPSGYSSSGEVPYFGKEGSSAKVPEKEQAINRFLETSRIELQHNLGIPVTADLSSLVMSSEEDGRRIGQNWLNIGLTGIDRLCPMIYPSSYANASHAARGNGTGSYIGKGFFEAPDLHPYDVVRNALEEGSKAARQKGFCALRPWLQAFTADYLAPGYFQTYSGAQIRRQIQAVLDAGYHEWLLWNPAGEYPPEAFLSKEEGDAEASKLSGSEPTAEMPAETHEGSETSASTGPEFPIAKPRTP